MGVEVVWSSFEGRWSDNPRALYEGFQRSGAQASHTWLVDPDHATGFPADVARVPYGSDRARAALEAADLVVSNTHIDHPWDKAPGTTYLQTWHGTPLKRIHFDVRWAPEGRLDRLTEDVRRWDLLVSPNAASTPLLRGAFGFEGEVLETGYPRNDVLSSARAPQVRVRVRAGLGIDEGARVVLYAPTWRDDAYFDDPLADVPLALDVAALTRELPGTVVLLRLHYLQSLRLAALDLPDVHDVSRYPDISELYLAADVLVTDYSSSMFDVAVTGTPILLFAYDLAAYRDELRGFYFDLDEIAPGPVLSTSEQVVAALADLPAVQARSAPAYARFRERFCALEDGGATGRVLQRVLAGVAA